MMLPIYCETLDNKLLNLDEGWIVLKVHFLDGYVKTFLLVR